MLLLWLVHAFAWTLCCFDVLGAVLCESSCFFRQVGHASALTLHFDSLVPSGDLNPVVNFDYSLVSLRVWLALVRLVVVVRAVARPFGHLLLFFSVLEWVSWFRWFVQRLEPRSICSVASFSVLI